MIYIVSIIYGIITSLLAIIFYNKFQSYEAKKFNYNCNTCSAITCRKRVCDVKRGELKSENRTNNIDNKRSGNINNNIENT